MKLSLKSVLNVPHNFAKQIIKFQRGKMVFCPLTHSRHTPTHASLLSWTTLADLERLSDHAGGCFSLVNDPQSARSTVFLYRVSCVLRTR